MESLLLPDDITYLREEKEAWDDLVQLHATTKRFQDWADGKKGMDGGLQGMDDYISLELLEGTFEPVMSTPALSEFAGESSENLLLLHVITATLRKICTGALAKMRVNGRGVFDEDGGSIINPQEGRRGQGGIDASAILKGAGRAGTAALSLLGKQDRDSVETIIKGAKVVLAVVAKKS